MPERDGAPAQPSVVSSPCIRNCCLDEDDICLGCYRSLTEICAWGAADDAQRREILHNATQRKQQRRHNAPENT